MEIFGIMVVFGIVCAVVAASKNRSVFGWFILGMLFSLLALLVLACLPSLSDSTASGEPSPDTHVKCPDCAELVLREARVCKHCGCRLVPQLK